MFSSLKSKIVVPVIAIMIAMVAIIIVVVSLVTSEMTRNVTSVAVADSVDASVENSVTRAVGDSVPAIVTESVTESVAESVTSLTDYFIDERLNAASSAVRAYLRSHEQQTFLAANAMGRSSELIRLIQEGNRTAIWQYAYNQKSHFGVAEIIIADVNGITLARSHMFDSFGDNVSGVPSIAAGLRREQTTLYTPTPTADMVMTTSSPILDGNTLVGSVVVNFVVGSFDFVDRISDVFGVDVTVFHLVDGHAVSVASTLTHPETGARLVGTPVANHINEAVIERGETMVIPDLMVLGILPYTSYYFPLPGIDGSPNGMFFIGIPLGDARNATNAIVDDLARVLSNDLVGALSTDLAGTVSRDLSATLSSDVTEAIVATLVSSLIRIISLVGVVCVVLAIVAMLLLIVKSLKPVDRLAVSVKDVASGNFNFNMGRNLSDDEIGRLTADVYNLVHVIKSMLDELDKFNREASINGDLDYRIDSARYQGAYKDMLDAMNKYADAFSEDIKLTMKILKQISDGEHNIKIPVLPGKKAKLSHELQNLDDVLDTVYKALINISENAAKGNFDVSVNASGLLGAWAQMIESMNVLTASVQEPLNEIRGVLSKVEQGLFDSSVKGNYAGDFKEIKNDMNSVVASLGAYIAEIDRCLNALSAGDLTYKMTMNFTGDFSRIESSIRRINESLNKTMSEISAASQQVLVGSQQITSSAMELANGASVQASSVQELNASIDMISQQTRQNAKNAEEANMLSGKSTQNAQDGNNGMQKMLEAMLQIKESSNNISKIIRVIQDIAFQTNLLALNAAVEAARAGEHGKGFAVVAEEVRSLAARSQTAATETTGMIADSLQRVDVGSGLASTTADALNVIVDSANDVLKIINSISSSSKEQAEAIGQIGEGLNQISQVVQSNSASSEETAAAAEELTAQAELLQKLVSYFKV